MIKRYPITRRALVARLDLASRELGDSATTRGYAALMGDVARHIAAGGSMASVAEFCATFAASRPPLTVPYRVGQVDAARSVAAMLGRT